MKIKKIVKGLVIFCLLLCMLPNTLAQATTKSILGVSTVYTDKVGTIQLAVFVASEEKIGSGSFELNYDSSILRIRDVDLTTGDAISSSFMSTNASEAGKVSVAWAGKEGQSLNGAIINISAYVLKAGQTATISFENGALYSIDGSEVAVELLDGEVKPFTGETTVNSTKEAANKSWTVTLSGDYNPATLNKYTVLVKNSRNIAVEVKLEKRTNNSFTVTPITNYPSGKYTLEITEQLRSVNGSKLNPARKHEFVIQ